MCVQFEIFGIANVLAIVIQLSMRAPVRWCATHDFCYPAVVLYDVCVQFQCLTKIFISHTVICSGMGVWKKWIFVCLCVAINARNVIVLLKYNKWNIVTRFAIIQIHVNTWLRWVRIYVGLSCCCGLLLDMLNLLTIRCNEPESFFAEHLVLIVCVWVYTSRHTPAHTTLDIFIHNFTSHTRGNIREC